jgi:endonuclease/exonuclease/phosphatase family metal-dependent hydrolase
MEEVQTGSFVSDSDPLEQPSFLRVVSWNINRGLELNAIIDFLSGSPADLILLQETDINARRTQWGNIPCEIAQALQMNYVFGREFEELAQGEVGSPAYHGQAILSRLPIWRPRILKFGCQSAFWRPRWFIPPLQLFQRRLGARMALICEISIQGRTVVVYDVHLESRGSDELRTNQLFEVLTDIRRHSPETDVLVAGDLNLDISRGQVANLIAKAQLYNPLTRLDGNPTSRRRHRKGAAIDWILTGNGLPTSNPQIHNAIGASDHYPISVQIQVARQWPSCSV